MNEYGSFCPYISPVQCDGSECYSRQAAYLMTLWLTIGVRDMYCTNTHSHLIVRDYQSVCHSGSYNCNSAHEPRFYLGAYV